MCREELGLDVRAGVLEPDTYPPDTFDVVSMGDVIEHVPDPLATLRTVARILKPGGHVLISTPNVDSAAARFLQVKPEEHIYYFSAEHARGQPGEGGPGDGRDAHARPLPQLHRHDAQHHLRHAVPDAGAGLPAGAARAGRRGAAGCRCARTCCADREEAVKALVTGGAGFIGSHLVDRLLAGGHEVTAYDNLSTGRAPFLDEAAAHAGFRLVEGDLLDPAALAARRRRARPRLPPRRQRRRALRHRAPAPRPRAEHHRAPATCSRRCARSGVRRIAFTSTGSVYGEPDVFPTPETLPVPGADEPLRRVQAGGRGPDRRLLPRLRLPGAASSASSRSSASATATATCSTSTASSAQDPARDRGAGRRQPAQVVPLRAGLRRRDAARRRARARARSTSLNLGTDEYCTVDDSLGWICARLGPRRRAGATPAATRGWIGDSPFIFLDTSRCARSAGARAHHPRGGAAHARLPRRRTRGCMERGDGRG